MNAKDILSTASRRCTRVAWALAALAVFSCIHATAAKATEFCVSTGATLNAALIIAASPTNQTTVIKLQQGTYHLGGSILLNNGENVFRSMQLLGGYNSDCSVRTLNPDNTVVDADGDNQIIFTISGNLVVEGIRWENNKPFFVEVITLSTQQSVRLANNAFIQGEIDYCTNCGTGSSYTITGNTLQIINNLLTAVPNKFGNGAISLQGIFDVEVSGNTVAENGNRGLFARVDGSMTLTNNLFWDNGNTDIELYNHSGEQTSATLKDNTYTTLTGSEDADSFGTSHADPAFVSPDTGDFHLQNSSPAVNSGIVVDDTPGVDLDGNARIVGSTVDRGAYESSVDDTLPSQILTVTNANDSGSGSLREAITNANVLSDYNYIQFNIPGTCPATITLVSGSLPSLAYGAKIDGFTQPGSVPNSDVNLDNAKRCVILNGGGSDFHGIRLSGTDTSRLWVQGLAFEGFTGVALDLNSGTGDVVLGNQFGGKVGATTLSSNATDIAVEGTALNALIGLDAPAFRNVIGGATSFGVLIAPLGSGPTNHYIEGNLFGVYGSGLLTGNAGNASAVRILGAGNTVSENIFANNQDGIDLITAPASGNTIQNNLIGQLPPICYVVLGIQHCLSNVAANGVGVRISSGAHDNLLQYNTIWNNTSDGVYISDASERNELLGNSMNENAGSAIALSGTTDGDNDAASGAANLPNRGINAPVATSAYGGSARGIVEGSLASLNGSYLIQIYASVPSTMGFDRFGETYLGSGTATVSHQVSGGNGHGTFRLPLSSVGTSLAGKQITLVATDSLGNTSIYSAAVPYLCDTIFANGFDDASTNACPAP